MSQMNRRDLLRFAAATPFLPALPSLLPARAEAQASTAPLRCIFIQCSDNGVDQYTYFPQVDPPQVAQGVYGMPLANIAGNLSPVFGSAWNGLKNKVSILRGLDLITGENVGHGSAQMLSGAMSEYNSGLPYARLGASVDWLLQRSTVFYPQPPQVDAIRFAPYAGGYYGLSTANVNGATQSLPYLSTDVGIYNQLFATLGNPAVDPVQRKTYLTQRWQERLDLLSQQRRLSAADRQRLQQHTEHMAAVRANLGRPRIQCTSAPGITFMQPGEPMRRVYENVNQMIVAAFACDITRLACISMTDFADDNVDYTFAHGVSHGTPDDTANAAVFASHNRWIGERVAHLINLLDTTVDIDGQMMSANTMLVAAHGMSNYWHRSEDIGMVVAGAPSKLRMGWYLDFRQRPFTYYAGRGDFPAMGRPYTQLLASIMQAAGLRNSDYDQFGQGGKFGEFTLGAYYNGQYAQFAATRTNPLPYFYL
ncbi:MAG: DUF1552 domain-containing protein [Burkholderiaceae bacterium]